MGRSIALKLSEKNLRFLLVEDNELNQELIKAILEDSKVDIVTANNGKEAIALLMNEGRFDLILMDIHMPVMDGIEATKIIKSIDSYKNIPIIALSADSSEAGDTKLKNARFDAYVMKPINVEIFFETIDSLLGTEGCASSCFEVKESSFLSTATHINATVGIAYMLDNPEMYEEMIRKYFERYQDFEERSREGFGRGGDEFRNLIHSFKGLSATIGAKELSARALKLEKEPCVENLESMLEEFRIVMSEIGEAL